MRKYRNNLIPTLPTLSLGNTEYITSVRKLEYILFYNVNHMTFFLAIQNENAASFLGTLQHGQKPCFLVFV